MFDELPRRMMASAEDLEDREPGIARVGPLQNSDRGG